MRIMQLLRNVYIVCAVGILIGFTALPTPVRAAQASLSLEPAAQSVTVGDSIDLSIQLDTGGANSSITDVAISYPAQQLKLISLTNGTLFQQYSAPELYPSSAQLSGWVSIDNPQFFKGIGVFATAHFLAIGAGAAEVSFDFIPNNPNDSSNVVDSGIIVPVDNPQINVDILTTVKSAHITIMPALPIPACDVCGKCITDTAIPDEYDQCIACMYTIPGPPPSAIREGVSWTVFGCMNTSTGDYLQQVYKIAGSAMGGTSFLVMLYGGFLILTSEGDSNKLYRGKKLITMGGIALLITLFAIFILRYAAAQLLGIPGFQ